MEQTEENIQRFNKAREIILGLNSKLKNVVRTDDPEGDFRTPGHLDVGVGTIDNKSVKRAIIILRGCGCQWSREEEGGCTMCGHFSGSTKGQPIPAHYLKEQFERGLAAYDFTQYPMLCLYNGGSFFNETELDPELRRYMYKKINAIGHIKRLIIESRPEYVSDAVLDEVEELMPNVITEIGVGLETRNDIIRELILNKGVTSDDLIRCGEKFKGRKTKMLSYVLVNPPFLTEFEAIEDTVESIKFAAEIGSSIASLEAVSIQHLTLVAFLAEAGHYRTPWIWSMFEIIKRVFHLGLVVRLGGFEFFPIPKEFTSNCSACNETMIGKIQQFNMTNDLSIVENLECPRHCELEWKEELKKSEQRDFADRIIDTFNVIDVNETINKLKTHCVS